MVPGSVGSMIRCGRHRRQCYSESRYRDGIGPDNYPGTPDGGLGFSRAATNLRSGKHRGFPVKPPSTPGRRPLLKGPPMTDIPTAPNESAKYRLCADWGFGSFGRGGADIQPNPPVCRAVPGPALDWVAEGAAYRNAHNAGARFACRLESFFQPPSRGTIPVRFVSILPMSAAASRSASTEAAPASTCGPRVAQRPETAHAG